METSSARETSSRRVVIRRDIPDAARSGLAEFIDRYYIRPRLNIIDEKSYHRTETDRSFSLSWRFRSAPREFEKPFSVVLTVNQGTVEVVFPDLDPTDTSLDKIEERTADDIEAVVTSYFDNLKMSSLYFVLGATEEHSEAPVQRSMMNRTLKRIFTGNSTNLFLIFTLASIFLFFLVGIYAIFLLIGLQLVTLVFSDRIIVRLGSVRPNAEKQFVTIASVRSNAETLKSISQHSRNILPQIREEVISTASVGDTEASIERLKSVIIGALMRHGIVVTGNDITIKTRNPYEIVRQVSEKFSRPTPKITITNTLIDNAAATGISSNRSTVMITAGSLEDLNDEELEAVIGHELGHVKGHDPIILFGATTFEFLGRFFVWTPLLYYLGLFYFFFAFGAIYLIGKFLETRADTESAVVIGKPGALAAALTKIGFRQLYREKYNPGTKLLDWFRFDPHPPIYFRITRLSRFMGQERPLRHTLLVSIRDVIVGFFSALISV